MEMGSYMWLHAFLVGGGICAVGQLLLDGLRIPAAYMLGILVVGGACLSGLGFYEPLLQFAGAGASIPITNFGHVLTRGALRGLAQEGFLGIFTGVLRSASAGLAATILFAFLTTCLFKARKLGGVGKWK